MALARTLCPLCFLWLTTEDEMDPKTILIGNDHGGYDLIPTS
jgi:hypothetical protein